MSTSRDAAIKYYNKAVEVNAADKQTSYKLFVSSVHIDPDFQEGWYACGNAGSDLGKMAGAIACYRRCLEADPGNAKAWCNLGHQLYALGRLREARETTMKALEIDDKLAHAWVNMSLIESLEGRLSKSLDSAKRANELEPGNKTIEMALAFAHLYARDWASGLRIFESRFPERLPQYLNTPYAPWRNEDISDKRLWVVSEQGMGDALCFMRFVPMAAARCQRLILQVQPELTRLAAGMLSHVKNLDIIPIPTSFPQADYWTSTMSLPVALGLTSAEIEACPNLPVPPIGVGNPPVWRVPNRKLHIGICWKGSKLNDIDRYRSMQVEQFLELCRVPGIQLYSLQVGDFAQEMHEACGAAPIKDMTPFIRDVTDTIAIMRHLDLIISVETALCHIAGAIDMECWMLLSYAGSDWRVGRTGNKSLWNPKHRIFRQATNMRWDSAIGEVVEALEKKVRRVERMDAGIYV